MTDQEPRSVNFRVDPTLHDRVKIKLIRERSPDGRRLSFAGFVRAAMEAYDAGAFDPHAGRQTAVSWAASEPSGNGDAPAAVVTCERGHPLEDSVCACGADWVTS